MAAVWFVQLAVLVKVRIGLSFREGVTCPNGRSGVWPVGDFCVLRFVGLAV